MNPKVFISYSWHPEENKVRVQRLAERLIGDGVNVILDVWDLKNGQDKYVFMEQMVEDSEIKKVLVICNKDYADKADSRKGGVGTESTIMSDEIYSKADQTKFIPIVFEKNENGEICKPHFLNSRIHIDMSTDKDYEHGYNQLLRDIYDKPLIKKPALGSMPAFLESDQPTFLSTAREQNFLKIINEETSSLKNWMVCYFDKLIDSLSQFKVTFNGGHTKKLVDDVEKSIDKMQVIIKDFMTFLENVAANEKCMGDYFVDFFEKLLQYYEDNDIELATSDDTWHVSNDNYRFFNYELFLSFVSIMLKHERFDIIHDVVSTDFCILSNRMGRQSRPMNFVEFQKYNYALDYYKKGIERSNCISEEAVLMSSIIDGHQFDAIVQADILLYYLSMVYTKSYNGRKVWYPHLSIYNKAFVILPKLVSCRYFEKVKVLFEVSTKEAFVSLIQGLPDKIEQDYRYRIPHVKEGLCVDKVCTLR